MHVYWLVFAARAAVAAIALPLEDLSDLPQVVYTGRMDSDLDDLSLPESEYSEPRELEGPQDLIAEEADYPLRKALGLLGDGEIPDKNLESRNNSSPAESDSLPSFVIDENMSSTNKVSASDEELVALLDLGRSERLTIKQIWIEWHAGLFGRRPVRSLESRASRTTDHQIVEPFKQRKAIVDLVIRTIDLFPGLSVDAILRSLDNMYRGQSIKQIADFIQGGPRIEPTSQSRRVFRSLRGGPAIVETHADIKLNTIMKLDRDGPLDHKTSRLAFEGSKNANGNNRINKKPRIVSKMSDFTVPEFVDAFENGNLPSGES
ncbi:MAG: hypothetical protein SGCHY_004277 [Lobulomycetales sp.]